MKKLQRRYKSFRKIYNDILKLIIDKNKGKGKYKDTMSKTAARDIVDFINNDFKLTERIEKENKEVDL
jgi:hypothetical protein